ncbi:MAG: DUF362 domain-containing protein [Deltaproteobacteria bacterium]|nr:DUF362 domain-containing protein [Deltaproteobacteria bacterium]
MRKTKVSICRLTNYEPENVRETLIKLLEPFGGITHFVKEGENILLKPNFLAPKAENTGVTTHPEIIRQAAKLASEAALKKVEVTDSPGIGSVKSCSKALNLVDDEFMIINNSKDAVWINPPKQGLQKLHMLKSIKDCDGVINLPKAKTHGQMIITAAVKNTFGAIAGLEKVQWHMRMGRDNNKFGQLVVHIHEMVAPRLNILDAVTAMEGNGPGNGTPRPLNFLMASDNAHAMDLVLCKIWDINPNKIYTLDAAKKMGLLPEYEDIEICGNKPEEFTPAPKWKMATPAGISNIIGPKWMAPLIEKLFTTKPLIKHKGCTQCLECKKHCPADAISNINNKMIIDYNKCISCFVCQEICPEGTILVHSGLLAKTLKLGR